MGQRRRDADADLVLDPRGPEVVGVDLPSVQLPSRDEVGELARRKVASLVLIDAGGMLVAQPPVDLDLVATVVVRLRGRYIGEFSTVDAVEFTVARELAPNQQSERLEHSEREGLGLLRSGEFGAEAGHSLHVRCAEALHFPKIRRSSYSHNRFPGSRSLHESIVVRKEAVT